jgi:hypothetical protein
MEECTLDDCFRKLPANFELYTTGEKRAESDLHDTLFFVLISPRDQHHARATELAATYGDHPFLVTERLLEIGN